MFRTQLILTTVLVLGVSSLSFGEAEAEKQKLRTVRTRDPKTGKTITKQVPIVQKEAYPHENTSVLVEAFVVDVSTEALAEVGVNPIGQAPEGISILKILACLDDPDKAEVISGAKTTACHNEESRLSNRNTAYFKIVQESTEELTKSDPAVITRSFEFANYDSGRTFSVMPHIQKDGRIRLEANFSYSEMIENEDQSIPPDQVGYDWRGVLTVKSGKPMIASAVQADESITFLILTATIQE